MAVHLPYAPQSFPFTHYDAVWHDHLDFFQRCPNCWREDSLSRVSFLKGAHPKCFGLLLGLG